MNLRKRNEKEREKLYVTKFQLQSSAASLGAGKTTLINKVLKRKHGEHIAVVINEFGEIGVDHQFVLDVEEEIYQMDNGCLCCTLRTDIADMLKSILMVKEQNGIRVDRVLFETTGLADPAPIAQTFINVPFLNEHFILDAVLTVVDSKTSYTKQRINLNQQNKLGSRIRFSCQNIA